MTIPLLGCGPTFTTPAGVQPADVGTLTLQYICDTLTSDYRLGPAGTPDVDLLNDKVAGTNDATQSTNTKMPHLTTGEIGNGHNSLLFSRAAQQQMQFTAGLFPPNGAIGIVCKPTVVGVPNYMTGQSGNSVRYLVQDSNGQYTLRVTSIYTTSGAPAASVSDWVNIIAVYERSGGADGCRIYVNGIEYASEDTSANAAFLNTDMIGQRGGSADTDFYSGYIAEYCYWSSLLTADDALQVHYGWQSKYGEWS